MHRVLGRYGQPIPTLASRTALGETTVTDDSLPCAHSPTVVGHVVGALEPDEETEIVGHLAQCAECRTVLEETLKVTHALGAAVPQLDPPPRLRENLLAAVRSEPEPVRARASEFPDPADVVAPVVAPQEPVLGARRPPGRSRGAMGVLMAVAALGLVLFGVRATLPVAGAPDGASSSVVAGRVQRVIDGADARGVRYAMLRRGPGELVAVVLDEPSGLRVVPVALAGAAAGQRYVLWASSPRAPVAVATVDSAAGTTVAFPGVTPPRASHAFAISVEPNGGVPARPSALTAVGSVS